MPGLRPHIVKTWHPSHPNNVEGNVQVAALKADHYITIKELGPYEEKYIKDNDLSPRMMEEDNNRDKLIGLRCNRDGKPTAPNEAPPIGQRSKTTPKTRPSSALSPQKHSELNAYRRLKSLGPTKNVNDEIWESQCRE